MIPRSGRRLWILAGVAAIGIGALALTIDDWTRDFTTNHAAIVEGASDPALRPRQLERTCEELIAATRRAARRIKGWSYIGEAAGTDATLVVFERTSRVWRFVDDVSLRFEDVDGGCRITGESRSRVGKGDLGQNPRNLRRILAELEVVLGE